jgi:hypothetical protein
MSYFCSYCGKSHISARSKISHEGWCKSARRQPRPIIVSTASATTASHLDDVDPPVDNENNEGNILDDHAQLGEGDGAMGFEEHYGNGLNMNLLEPEVNGEADLRGRFIPNSEIDITKHATYVLAAQDACALAVFGHPSTLDAKDWNDFKSKVIAR